MKALKCKEQFSLMFHSKVWSWFLFSVLLCKQPPACRGSDWIFLQRGKSCVQSSQQWGLSASHPWGAVRGGCGHKWLQRGCCSCPAAEWCSHLLFFRSMRCLTQPRMWGTTVPGNGRASKHWAVTTSQRFYFLKLTPGQALTPLKQALKLMAYSRKSYLCISALLYRSSQ